MFVEKAMIVLTWIVLAIWTIGPIVVMILPPKQQDPQRGMALGLLMIVAMIGAGFSAIFAAGLYWDLWLLIRVPTWIAAFITVLVLVNVVRWVVHIAKAKEG